MDITFPSLSRKGSFYKATEDDFSLRDHVTPETHPISSRRMLCQLLEYSAQDFLAFFVMRLSSMYSVFRKGGYSSEPFVDAILLLKKCRRLLEYFVCAFKGLWI